MRSVVLIILACALSACAGAPRQGMNFQSADDCYAEASRKIEENRAYKARSSVASSGNILIDVATASLLDIGEDASIDARLGQCLQQVGADLSRLPTPALFTERYDASGGAARWDPKPAPLTTQEQRMKVDFCAAQEGGEPGYGYKTKMQRTVYGQEFLQAIQVGRGVGPEKARVINDCAAEQINKERQSRPKPSILNAGATGASIGFGSRFGTSSGQAATGTRDGYWNSF